MYQQRPLEAGCVAYLLGLPLKEQTALEKPREDKKALKAGLQRFARKFGWPFRLRGT